MMDCMNKVSVFQTESKALRAAIALPGYSWPHPGPTGGFVLKRRRADDHQVILCEDGKWRRFENCWFPPAEIKEHK